MVRTSSKAILFLMFSYWFSFGAMHYDLWTYSQYSLIELNIEFALTAIGALLYLILRELEAADSSV